MNYTVNLITCLLSKIVNQINFACMSSGQCGRPLIQIQNSAKLIGSQHFIPYTLDDTTSIECVFVSLLGVIDNIWYTFPRKKWHLGKVPQGPVVNGFCNQNSARIQHRIVNHLKSHATHKICSGGIPTDARNLDSSHSILEGLPIERHL